MSAASKNENGLYSDCKFKDAHFEELNRNFARLNEREAEKDRWTKEYIDRTMPIKSHFWILLSSLSILASFAAVIQYLDKLTH